MNRIFLDTNFIMDLLAREGDFQANAIKVLEIGASKKIKFYVSFLTLANFAYITRKDSKENLFDNLKTCCRLFTVIPNEKSQLINSINLNPNDLEDAIQFECAKSEKCECIITRDPEGFEFSSIPIISPVEFINQFQ